MTALNTHQLKDALMYVELLQLEDKLPDTPAWGDGNHLLLPQVIPLTSDYTGEDTVYAWLVANDFSGYDLMTEDPTKKEFGA